MVCWLRSSTLLALASLAGCSQLFGLDAPVRGDAGGPHDAAISEDATDGAVADDAVSDASAATIVPLHVPGEVAGTGDVSIQSSMTINTTDLSIGSTLPAGVTFTAVVQTTGPEVAVLHVRTFTIGAPAVVRVIGLRPLIVIASGKIEIVGILDAGAQRDTPGAGGYAIDAGPGKGGPGTHAGSFRDSGGGGGGFGTPGGMGGLGGFGCSPFALGGAAGVAYGNSTLTSLVGGAGGGTGYATSCPSLPAGAGGGAVQLSSATDILISGKLNAGGGGGGAGLGNNCVQISAGSGGGSGGAIVLQAPSVSVAGVIAANGGAGGSAGGDPNNDSSPPYVDGEPGQDGQPLLTRASPGDDKGRWSAAGGGGGAATLPAVNGLDDTECDGNGGGGGGGVGRIVIATPSGTSTVVGVESPAHVSISY